MRFPFMVSFNQFFIVAGIWCVNFVEVENNSCLAIFQRIPNIELALFYNWIVHFATYEFESQHEWFW